MEYGNISGWRSWVGLHNSRNAWNVEINGRGCRMTDTSPAEIAALIAEE
jgi:hypothetical protein